MWRWIYLLVTFIIRIFQIVYFTLRSSAIRNRPVWLVSAFKSLWSNLSKRLLYTANIWMMVFPSYNWAVIESISVWFIMTDGWWTIFCHIRLQFLQLQVFMKQVYCQFDIYGSLEVKVYFLGLDKFYWKELYRFCGFGKSGKFRQCYFDAVVVSW